MDQRCQHSQDYAPELGATCLPHARPLPDRPLLCPVACRTRSAIPPPPQIANDVGGEVVLMVQGVARVPLASSTYGSVVKVLTAAGTITIDGTALGFDDSTAPVFEQAGFIVDSGRRRLLGEGQGRGGGGGLVGLGASEVGWLRPEACGGARWVLGTGLLPWFHGSRCSLLTRLLTPTPEHAPKQAAFTSCRQSLPIYEAGPSWLSMSHDMTSPPPLSLRPRPRRCVRGVWVLQLHQGHQRLQAARQRAQAGPAQQQLHNDPAGVCGGGGGGGGGVDVHVWSGGGLEDWRSVRSKWCGQLLVN